MVSTFEFIKDNLEIILAVLSIPIGLKSFITFISAKPIERQLFSKEKKILYQFINLFSLFIIFPTIFFYAIQVNNILSELIIKLFGYFVIILIFLCLIIILKKLLFPKKRKKWFKWIYKKQIILLISSTKFDIIITFFTIILAWIVFGSLNASFFTNPVDTSKILGIILIISFELYLIYLTLVWGTNIKFTPPLLVSIKMENGDLYDKYYIYHPSEKNFILIGKNINPDLCEEPILINVDKIMSCKPVKAIYISQSKI